MPLFLDLSDRFQLQWGRRFLTAETASRAVFKSSKTSLQWGRRFLTAETNNGDKKVAVPVELQWGRRFLTAETGNSGGPLLNANGTSMGPPFFNGGNPILLHLVET